MELEQRNGSDDGENEFNPEEGGPLDCETRDRPEDWDRIASEELDAPDLEEYPIPDREDLERTPAEEFYES